MKTYLYRHWTVDKKLLYVGISLSAVQRTKQHSQTAHWFDEIDSITIETFNTREEALEAEKLAIMSEKPIYNIHHTHKHKERAETFLTNLDSYFKLYKLYDLYIKFTPGIDQLSQSDRFDNFIGQLPEVILQKLDIVEFKKVWSLLQVIGTLDYLSIISEEPERRSKPRTKKQPLQNIKN